MTLAEADRRIGASRRHLAGSPRPSSQAPSRLHGSFCAPRDPARATARAQHGAHRQGDLGTGFPIEAPTSWDSSPRRSTRCPPSSTRPRRAWCGPSAPGRWPGRRERRPRDQHAAHGHTRLRRGASRAACRRRGGRRECDIIVQETLRLRTIVKAFSISRACGSRACSPRSREVIEHTVEVFRLRKQGPRRRSSTASKRPPPVLADRGRSSSAHEPVANALEAMERPGTV